jgi:regulatory protein
MTTQEALQKLRKFCAYQERSPFEVERKLYSLKLPKERHDDVIASLMDENFLDEHRFAEAYVRGKLNQKYWAPMRIRMGLQEHRIPRVVAERALKEIPTERIAENAVYLVDRWLNSKTKEQLTSALQRRGYSYETIEEAFERVERSTR